jgi:predicted Rossmann-fold nucleotide-binding protein
VSELRRVCVFCGSNSGSNPAYRRRADQLGRTLAIRGLGLVFGGGRVGLMGALADGALAAGGEVIGVMPQALDPDGFFAPLVAFLDHLVVSGFVQPQYRAILHAAESPEELLAAFAAYQPPQVARWVGPAQT